MGGLIAAALVAGFGALSDADYAPVDPDEARLGWLLFYDPILSGNRNISCASCHHPRFATSDGLSLGLGEGAVGLGPARHVTPENTPEQRIPRNAPALFNLGAREFTVLFHDGRIAADPARPSGLRTPLDEDMVSGFASVLSAQTMFPVLSPDEMAGHYAENEISKAVRSGRITGPDGAWDLIARRVAAIPAYDAAFRALSPEIAAGRPLAFTDISNAIAAFVAQEWRSDTSPLDAILRAGGPLPRGAAFFYGAAGCGGCHSGPFQTDHAFHAMGAPQIGPGKTERFESHSRDEGRFRVTGDPADLFAFRTPSLRNVTQTGPWGHAGAHSDLRAFLRAHSDPRRGLAEYDRAQAVLPALPDTKPDWAILDSPAERAALADAAVAVRPLSEDEITLIVDFLDSLSDPVALRGRLGVPDAVPSGLPVER
ncbi:cytochrome-c peroxidase [Phaeovulum vinaykumarii]|uniref:Cytochrome c peroxidase n=1 Tax=Phaeovulum vinaykumarii TaxID=407234 RepID=A0A1N7K8L9_9RHOB|nr:cytochrome-c peroxidase [Phaeovulum vinaykumarii]SIS57939.1 cytochrome c peroxidase [Phaeovulum vinaykumarii]SOB93630.1 cytochrome c peroxidase [Phaeovulum vinaykumarii]